MTDHIYSYYADVGCTTQTDLIQLWVDRWTREGWKAVVLGEDLAKQDPRYEAMMSKARVLPCVNHRGFERANFERWLAFSTVDGAITDYDVFPRCPFPPKEFPGFWCGETFGGPGWIVGTKADFSRIADLLLAYEAQPDDLFQGTPHVSDMTILQRQQGKSTIYDHLESIIQCFDVPGWENLPLVHFGNASIAHLMRENVGHTKAQVVAMLLDKYYRK